MFRDSFWGLGGFDELRKYIKQGNEFCKEVSAIMQERSEIENNYAKSLSKLSSKLAKAATGTVGTLASAWSMVGTEMEAEAELHRSLSGALLEDIFKPMKNLAESQHKIRKPMEGVIDKALKAYTDKKTEENKTKKASFTCAKEREKLSDQLKNARSGKKGASERDVGKLEKKVKQLEEEMRKFDKSYYDTGLKMESCRQDWESAVFKGSALFQNLEEERITHMQDFMNKYNSHLSIIGPKLVKSCERLGEANLSIEAVADIRTVIDQKGTGPNQPEQQLLEFYAEDANSHMDRERRRQALQNYLLYIQQDIEKELKGKEGVEKLVEVYQNRPNFADAEAQEDARQRLSHVSSMLNFLEATHYKITCAVANLEGRPNPVSKYSQYIEKGRDKQGINVSTLRLPNSMIFSAYPAENSSAYRPPADGSHSDNNYDDDEFDNYDPQSPVVIGHCRAIYDYAACQYDELTIHSGETIKIYDKQEDGWWQGELNGRVGIFPATYVEETQG